VLKDDQDSYTQIRAITPEERRAPHCSDMLSPLCRWFHDELERRLAS
jgi:hypothetical protein